MKNREIVKEFIDNKCGNVDYIIHDVEMRDNITWRYHKTGDFVVDVKELGFRVNITFKDGKLVITSTWALDYSDIYRNNEQLARENLSKFNKLVGI